MEITLGLRSKADLAADFALSFPLTPNITKNKTKKKNKQLNIFLTQQYSFLFLTDQDTAGLGWINNLQSTNGVLSRSHLDVFSLFP